MKDHEQSLEETINEIAKILAQGYLRLRASQREIPAGTTAAEAPTPTPEPPRRKSRKQEALSDSAPLPAPPPRSEHRAPISEEDRAIITEKLNRFSKMTTKELKAEHERLFGRPPQHVHKQSMFKRIAWEIQAQIEGRLPDAVRAYACKIAEQTDLFKRIDENLKKRNAGIALPESKVVPGRKRRPAPCSPKPRDPRLPAPGSLLILKRGRETVRVTVLESGFEYASQKYRSLTAVGRAVAGRSVDAFEFLAWTNGRSRKGRRAKLRFRNLRRILLCSPA